MDIRYILTRIECKVLLIVLKAQMGVALKYLRDAIRLLPHPFVLYVPWTGGSFLSLGLGQPWPCLDLLPLLPLLFGIALASLLSSNLSTSLSLLKTCLFSWS